MASDEREEKETRGESHAEAAARNITLSLLVEEVRALGRILDPMRKSFSRMEAGLERVEHQGTELSEAHKVQLNHFLKFVERQRKDRERIRRLEDHVFHTDEGRATFRPPMRSDPDDSTITDITKLQAQIASIQPHVEAQVRRESWFAKKKWEWGFAVVIAILAAFAGWVADHLNFSVSAGSKSTPSTIPSPISPSWPIPSTPPSTPVPTPDPVLPAGTKKGH